MRASLATTMCLLLACMAGCVAVRHRHTTSENVKSITINNGILYVSYDVNDGTFSARRGEKVFVKEARFKQGAGDGIPKVHTVNIQDALGSA